MKISFEREEKLNPNFVFHQHHFNQKKYISDKQNRKKKKLKPHISVSEKMHHKMVYQYRFVISSLEKIPRKFDTINSWMTISLLKNHKMMQFLYLLGYSFHFVSINNFYNILFKTSYLKISLSRWFFFPFPWNSRYNMKYCTFKIYKEGKGFSNNYKFQINYN